MEIWLDNAATTRCDRAVVSLMERLLTEEYGNPSSAHRMGFHAEQYVREAAERIAKILRCKHTEIVFTSGGTESDNLALSGAARANAAKGKRVITSRIEHPAVRESVRALEKEGFDCVFLPCDHEGILDLCALEDALTPDTILVSVMAVNNEIGSVQPLREIGARIKEKAPQALFHTDAVQGFAMVPFDIKKAKIDLMSVSAHKLHGPKGAGFLYVREGVRLQPVMYGGGQQNDLRPGTENVPGIAGMGLAAELVMRDAQDTRERLYALRAYLCEGLVRDIEGVMVHGAVMKCDREKCAPHILSFAIPSVRAEVMLHALEDRGIYVSGGSACASRHPAHSKTLQTIGAKEEALESTIRISMSKETTKEEIDITLQAIRELAAMLGKYTRR